MALNLKLRAMLHRKRWEPLTPSPASVATGSFLVADRLNKSRVFEIDAVSSIYCYFGDRDAFVQLPNSGATGTFGAGSCGTMSSAGPSGTATGGSTTTVITNLTIVRDLRGHKILFTAGPNAGVEATIKSNTIGTNSVITLTTTLGTAVTAATQYLLRTGRVYFLNAGTPWFGYYDWALNTWTTRSTTNLAASWGTEGQLVMVDPVSTGALISGTATAGAASTLTDGAKAWVTNALSNLQVRITGGTGAGQIRTIASNTGTVLTTSAAWTTNPDATSTYVIEGNDDFIYLLGNGSATMYKFQVSTNTWSTVTPAVARSSAPGAGMTADIIFEATDPDWVDVTQPKNGRYIYSFRGSGSNTLSRYDIALNQWADISYGAQNETFTTGTSSAGIDGRIIINKDAGTRLLEYDAITNEMKGYATLIYGQSTAVAGTKVVALPYTEGGVTVNFLYLRRSNATEFFRMIDFV